MSAALLLMALSQLPVGGSDQRVAQNGYAQAWDAGPRPYAPYPQQPYQGQAPQYPPQPYAGQQQQQYPPQPYAGQQQQQQYPPPQQQPYAGQQPQYPAQPYAGQQPQYPPPQQQPYAGQQQPSPPPQSQPYAGQQQPYPPPQQQPYAGQQQQYPPPQQQPYAGQQQTYPPQPYPGQPQQYPPQPYPGPPQQYPPQPYPGQQPQYAQPQPDQPQALPPGQPPVPPPAQAQTPPPPSTPHPATPNGQAPVPPPPTRGASAAAAQEPPTDEPPLPPPPPPPQQPPRYVQPNAPFAPPPQLESSDGGTGGLLIRGGVEAGFTSWPSGSPQDLFFDIRPLLSLSSGDDFGIDLGATFHLRVFDDPPEDRSRDIGGVLRRADWDELSDFGQILHFLRIGKLDSAFWVRAGAVTFKTFGEGHLINRYSNQDNPEYHPASAAAGVRLGPVRAEAFISDILGARIFAGLAGLELGRLIASDPKWFDRFWFTLEGAYDAGQAGGVSPTATLFELDFTAVFFRSSVMRWQVLTGAGMRVNSKVDGGALLGLSADFDLDGFLFSAKIEGRKQAGGYRQGFFGPQYEISRFIGSGFSGVPLADEVLPDSFSFYGEVRVGKRGFLVAEAELEHFIWGRTDFDVSVTGEMFGSRFTTAARFTGVALGVLPRYAVSADARFRIFRSLYLYGAGGTLFFAQVNGTLTRGVFISAGVGGDFQAQF